MKLFLKGTKCTTDKCPFTRRGYAPGQHGKGRVKLSEYAVQLREKQKVRRIYGVFERQFRRYFHLAARARGVTGETLLTLLERRLDNVVFRLGFATSRPQARQMVRHGHVTVNGRRVTLPSFLVRQGQVVRIVGSEAQVAQVRQTRELTKDRAIPGWLTLEAEALQATVTGAPGRADVQFPIQEQLIVELYSK